MAGDASSGASVAPGTLRSWAAVVYGGGGDFAAARGTATWDDRIGVALNAPVQGLNGRPGRVIFDWAVEGALNSAGDRRAIFNAQLSVFDASSNERQLDRAGGQVRAGVDRSFDLRRRGVTMPFVFGEPLRLAVWLDVDARSPGRPLAGS